MEYLRCVVERITYQNAENGYTVLKCAAKNQNDLVTVVGTMPDTHVGSVLSLEGFWKIDAKYGKQFLVQKFEETLPATVYGIEKYLGSGLIKGVGPKYAKKIVAFFELTPYFDAVIGSSMEHSDASKAYLMQRAMQQLHIPEAQKEQVVMIGDRKFDAEGAAACGLPFIGVHYGYAPAGELESYPSVYLADTVSDLKTFLLEHAAS